MADPKTKNKRGKDYVDPQVQGALWRRLIFHWCAFMVVTATLVVILEWMSNPFRPATTMLSEAWWTYGPLLVVLLCLAPVFVYDSIRLSNRFAGPIYRIRKVVKSLAEGRPAERVEFRDNDFWRELADDLNRVIDRVEPKPPTKAS